MEIKQHTPSAGGIIFRGNDVLLIYSPSRKSYEFPKGTIDPGETTEITALREVKEETGYNVQIIKHIYDSTFEFEHTNGTHYTKTITYFKMQLVDNIAPRPNLQPGEDFTNIWVPIDEAYDLLTFDDAKKILRLAIN